MGGAFIDFFLKIYRCILSWAKCCIKFRQDDRNESIEQKQFKSTSQIGWLCCHPYRRKNQHIPSQKAKRTLRTLSQAKPSYSKTGCGFNFACHTATRFPLQNRCAKCCFHSRWFRQFRLCCFSDLGRFPIFSRYRERTVPFAGTERKKERERKRERQRARERGEKNNTRKGTEKDKKQGKRGNDCRKPTDQLLE